MTEGFMTGGQSMIDQQTSFDPMDDMVGAPALELLEAPADERVARWELFKDKVFWTAVDQGMSKADAFDMSEKVGQWTLDLIARIEVTGGGCGGHA